MKYIGIRAEPGGYLYRSPCYAPKVLATEPETQCLSFIVKLEQVS